MRFMCGRFTLRTSSATLAKWYREVDFPVVVPRYNIAPTQQVLALRADQDRQWEAVKLRWGLVPSWADDLRIGNRLINARSETAATKPAFRQAFKRRRCLILADGFYEWKTTRGGKQPYLIESSDSDSPLICFAALWEIWKPKELVHLDPPGYRQTELFPPKTAMHSTTPTAESVESCTILTTTANSLLSQLHDRMPVILDEPTQKIWLDPTIEDGKMLTALLNPCPANRLRLYPVSKLVNLPANDNIACTVATEVVDDA
jgi:putative SOS response-associated peptidase YedK